MKKISLLVFLLIIAACSSKTEKSTSVTENKSTPPNIIFVMVDDQGYGDIGVFHQNERAQEGLPYQITPNLDGMAAEGALFTQQYSSSPVCAPSRASLITGVHQGHANVRDNQFDKALEDNYNMANTLKTLGYQTAAIGKWGLQGDDQWEEGGNEWPAKPTKRGFDYFFGYMRHMDGHEHYPKEGVYRGRKEVWMNEEMITDKLDKSYTTDLWTAAAKKWIVDHQEESQDQPFFIYLAYDTPHAVLELPTQAYPEGGGLEGGIQWLGEEGHFINTASGEVDSYVYPEYASATYDHDQDSTTAEVPWPETYQRYATANRRIDDAMGDLLQLLKDLDIDEHTLVVYTSDNGAAAETYLGDWQAKEERELPTFFQSYGPFDGIKRDTWEGGLRIPALAWWPGTIEKGKVIDMPTIHYDWPVTFIEAAGSVAPARMDGVSLLSALKGEDDFEDSSIYVEYFFNGKTPTYADFATDRQGRVQKNMQNIRVGDYMGVRYDVQSADDDFEIYDVRRDPQQTNNLAEEMTSVEVKLKDGFGGITTKEMNMRELNALMKEKVLQQRIPADDIERPYDSALVPAVDAEVENGVSWAFYAEETPWISQLTGLKPYQEGVSEEGWTIPEIDVDQGVILFKAYLKIPEDGEYTFFTPSDSQLLMRLHDIRVLDTDYPIAEQNEVKQTVNLKAGLHPIRLYKKIGEKEEKSPAIKWEGPDFSKTALDKTNLFTDKN